MSYSFLTPQRVNHFLSMGFSALFVVAVSFFLVFTLTSKGVATTPDSLAYIAAAKHIAHGDGVVIPDFKLTTSAYEKPMTAWPPLYPVLLSWVVADHNPEQSIRIFNAITLSVLGIFFMLLLIKPNSLMGLLGVLILLLQGSIITVYSYAWSETIFLPLLVATYFFLVNYCQTANRYYLGLTILAIVMLSYARYIGIIFLCPIMVMIFTSSLSTREKKLSAATIVAVSILMFIPLIIRNILIIGAAGGDTRESSSSHLFSNIVDVANLLAYHLLSIWSGYLFIIIFILIAILLWIAITHIQNKQLSNLLRLVIWPMCWVVFYIVAIILLRTWKDFDVLDTRLISPAIVFFLLSMMSFINLVIVNQRHKWLLILMGVWAIGLIFHGAHFYSAALMNWRQQSSHAYPMTESAQYGNFTAHPGSAWILPIYQQIQQITNNNDPVIIVDGSQSMLFKHLTSAKVKELPFTLTKESLDNINQRGVGALIVTTPVGINTLKNYYGTHIGEMSALPELLKYNVLVIKLPLPVSINPQQK